MKIKTITKVVFHKLLNKSDRRGTIATFHLEKVSNHEYVQYLAIYMLLKLTSTLSPHYSFSTENIIRREYTIEKNECWISRGVFDEELYKVRVLHKYWSDKQVGCFKQMIIALSNLHGWEVVDLTLENDEEGR